MEVFFIFCCVGFINIYDICIVEERGFCSGGERRRTRLRVIVIRLLLFSRCWNMTVNRRYEVGSYRVFVLVKLFRNIKVEVVWKGECFLREGKLSFYNKEI